MFTQHVVSKERTPIVIVKPHDSHLSTWPIDDNKAQEVIVRVYNMVGVENGSPSVAFIHKVVRLLVEIVVGGGGLEAHPRDISYVIQLTCEHYPVYRKSKINTKRSAIFSGI